MKKITTLLLCLVCAVASYGWGQKGHDVVAAIAERHLTPAARQFADSLLDGRSLVYWANWLDNASYTPELRYTKTWHYKNVNEGVEYEAMSANPAGDAVTAIKSTVETLTDSARSIDDKVLALKILIHVTGDLHQPMHMGHATDLGGNRIKVKYFGRDTNLHTVWDTNLVESAHKWSYTEWADQLDRGNDISRETYAPWMVDLWAKGNVSVADSVYKAMPEKTDIKYNEIVWATPVIEQQLLAGGLRLAIILNYIANTVAVKDIH